MMHLDNGVCFTPSAWPPIVDNFNTLTNDFEDDLLLLLYLQSYCVSIRCD